MPDVVNAPAAAPEAAVAVSAPVVAAPVAPVAPVAEPAKPTPQELRSGKLWGDPARAKQWLGLDAPAETPAVAPAAPVAATPAPTETPAAEGTETPEPDAADGVDPTAPGYRRAGERGPKLELVGADGQPVALDVATIKVRTKAGGEVVELTLPELARKAASEVGLNRQNAHLQTQLTTQQQSYEARLTDALAQAEQAAQLAIRAVTDDGERARLAAKLQDYYSPEQQVARASASLHAERQSLAQQQQQAAATGFFNQVATTVAGLESQYPHVPPAELAGHFHALTAPITGPDGRVPPQHWPQLHAIVTQELPRLAAERNASLGSLIAAASAAQTAQAQQATLAAETTRAQQAAQQAVNTFARATRPAGTVAAEGAPAKPPIKSLRDAQAWARQVYQPGA